MLHVRAAVRADFEVIARIHVECWAECYGFIPLSVHSARSFEYRCAQWRRDLVPDRQRGAQTLVLLDRGEVVGFSHLKPADAADFDGAGYELHSMYLRGAARGGVGSLLLLRAHLVWLAARGARSFAVWVFCENPMRRAYLAVGFKIRVRRNRVLCGVAVPELGLISPAIEVLAARVDRLIAFRCGGSFQPENQQQC